ncbi:uncharacterized protein LOC121757454 [Salvia splendens]|uniref:uncharacterized protein LOC121757454 n=1 Tax=Salvia splendens TaxID=180675 RepID=UPI001C25D05D|nr:uncharacterized protein LOC121757454 [Salvia splendens]
MQPPRFDGSDATNWISRVQYYFDHVMMPDAQRLHYAVMLFDPPASEWVFYYCAKTNFVTWQEFLEDVRHRFDRQSFKDYFGLITKLTQTGTVLEYHNTFEKYLNRVQGVPASKLFTLFIAGLKPEIQERLTLHRPTSLAAAMALSLELADTQADRNLAQPSSGFQRRQWQGRDHRTSTGPAVTQQPTANAAGAALPVGPTQRQREQPRPPAIRVSQAEKSERSRLGLCWHCPEKWVFGHVCKQRLLCYADEEESAAGVEIEDIPDDEALTEIAHIHALEGGRRSSPLKVLGQIMGRGVCILVDTGSDRDFLHPNIAESLHLPLSPIRPFRVFVGNGAALLCTHMARRTRLTVQGSVFTVDLHILPIHGPDVILGMDWLESLGKIFAEFASKTLEFVYNGHPFTLRGITSPPCRLQAQSLLTLHASREVSVCFEIALLELGAEAPEPVAFPADLPAGITAVLGSFSHVFNIPTEMPPALQFDHRIHLLPGAKPVNVRTYRYPYFQKNEIERQVREMLEQGIIQRSSSPFSSPVLLIRKKDGSYRFCIDYRALNNVTVPDHFPIPTVDELFDELGKARVFSKLDLRSGYHQIRMHEEDVFKTAFRTHDGHFEFLVMPFGLTNAPSTFQATMNAIFQPMLRKFVIVFFDDILIYSPTLADHETHLAAVLTVLQEHSFFVKQSKCYFCSSTVEYLGHIITDGLLKADPNKIEAMTAWPIPRTVKQLPGFLGLTGYYRIFVAQYALIAAPLTDLLKKEAFIWSPAAEVSFLALKEAMTRAPVLRLPDFGRTFCVETDASDSGIGAVLLQDNHPIAFYSKKLGLRRRVASTYHKELYAIVEAVQKWRQYLLGHEFVIRSDQKSLKELLQQVVQTPDQQLYVRKLMGYKFSIEYKKGSTNRVADALSRREESQSAADAAIGADESCPPADQQCQQLVAASQPVPHLLELLRRETASSPEMRELTAAIRAGSAAAHLSMVDGLVYFKRRIYVGEMVLLKLQPYRQHSVARPKSAKLARRYYGPFEVLERIGPVAYRLRLPEGSRIHNVFHVSLLRAFVAGDAAHDSLTLPSEFFGDRPVVYPVRVLDRKVLWQGERPVEHVLVRWSDGTDSPTWEPTEMVQRRYPNVLLEDKEVAMGEGVDTILQQPDQEPIVDVTEELEEVGEVQETVEEQRRRTDEDTRAKGVREEASIAKTKPTRNARPPNRFGDFVAK